MTTILVTGGTGTLGRHVVTRLRAGGHDVRVLTRHTPPYDVDLREGDDGLDRALDGTGTVVHCATSARGGDEQAARNLIAAARRAGVEHLVYISIVGVDRVPFPYYRTKLAVERQFEDSGTGWTVLRATQFHDLLFRLFQGLSKSPVMPLPARVKDQPVDVRRSRTAWRNWPRAPPPPRGRHGRPRDPHAPLAGARLPGRGGPPPRGGEGPAPRLGLRGVPRGWPPGTGTGRREADVRGVPGGTVRGDGGGR